VAIKFYSLSSTASAERLLPIPLRASSFTVAPQHIFFLSYSGKSVPTVSIDRDRDSTHRERAGSCD
jgi:hypothetical protein